MFLVRVYVPSSEGDGLTFTLRIFHLMHKEEQQIFLLSEFRIASCVFCSLCHLSFELFCPTPNFQNSPFPNYTVEHSFEKNDPDGCVNLHLKCGAKQRIKTSSLRGLLIIEG